MVKIKQVWRSIFSKPQQLEQTGDIVESGAEVSQAVLEFAIALGVLATVPTAPVVAAALPFVGIARKGLKLLHEQTNEEVELEKWVALAYPLAYLNSFNALVQRNVWLQAKLSAEITEQEVKSQFNQLGELELTNSHAEEALTSQVLISKVLTSIALTSMVLTSHALILMALTSHALTSHALISKVLTSMALISHRLIFMALTSHVLISMALTSHRLISKMLISMVLISHALISMALTSQALTLSILFGMSI